MEDKKISTSLKIIAFAFLFLSIFSEIGLYIFDLYKFNTNILLLNIGIKIIAIIFLINF